MNLNEMLLLMTVCWSSLFLLWVFIKFQNRNLPTFEEALSIYMESTENLLLITAEQSELLKKRIKILKQERGRLLEDYDDPDKTYH